MPAFNADHFAKELASFQRKIESLKAEVEQSKRYSRRIAYKPESGPGRPARPDMSDPRLPPIGESIVRRWEDKTHKVKVLADGFEYEGAKWASLSSIGKAITGWPTCNGFEFFGLTEIEVG